VPGLMPITARALVWVSNSRGGFRTPALSASQFLPSAVAAELKSVKLPAIQWLVKAASAALGMVEALAATQASPVCRNNAWQQPCVQGGVRGDSLSLRHIQLQGNLCWHVYLGGAFRHSCSQCSSSWVLPSLPEWKRAGCPHSPTASQMLLASWLCQPRLQHWCCSVRCNVSALLAALGRKMEPQLLAWPFLPT
jgi:hypothetical protein